MRTTVQDGMLIQWHVPIEMDDGNVLDADVYRPNDDGTYPNILSYGIYGKGLSFQDEIYRMQWEKLVSKDPSVLERSTNAYQTWEVVDPERWIPHGYAVVRVDSSGEGWSPGHLDPRSPREVADFTQCIEWAQAPSRGAAARSGRAASRTTRSPRAVRDTAGRDPMASARIVDAQSVKAADTVGRQPAGTTPGNASMGANATSWSTPSGCCSSWS